MIENFTNLYSLSKTLRFKLIPQGKTLDFFKERGLLAADQKRAKDYAIVKKLMDQYHKVFIDDVLSSGKIIPGELLQHYALLYYKTNKTEHDEKEQTKMEADMRTYIARSFKSDTRQKSLFEKDMLTKYLPQIISDDEETDAVKSFSLFFTFFSGFNQNRQNLYVSEEKSGSIAFRCINENLPKFLDNSKSFERIVDSLPQCDLKQLDKDFTSTMGITSRDHFLIDYYNFVLSERGIEEYNNLLGGYTLENGEKIKGINEYVNLYNQQLLPAEKNKRLPLLKPLYKQVLSDRNTLSFVSQKFVTDQEVYDAINIFFTTEENNSINLWKALEGEEYSISNLFGKLTSFDLDKIWVGNKSVTEISTLLSGSWSAFKENWYMKYDQDHEQDKKNEKYYEKREKEFKGKKSISLKKISDTLNLDQGDVQNVLLNRVWEIRKNIREKYTVYVKSFDTSIETSLADNVPLVESLKALLDSVKEFEAFLRIFIGTGKEEEKDENFYGCFLLPFAYVASIDRLYDRVRDYITKKPYSTEKIKLTFNHYQLLGGWDKSKEKDYLSILLRDGDKYYLGILDKDSRSVFEKLKKTNDVGSSYEKMEYKYLPGPNKMLPKVFFSTSRKDEFNPSEEILRINREGTFKKENFVKEDCTEYIRFCQQSIEKNSDWSAFGFRFKKPEEYSDIVEFYTDVAHQGYKVRFSKYSKKDVNALVESGKLYLFQIYNKDFSSYSKGKKNLHTLYFLMLFDDRNLKDVVFKLSGGAELFYRPASIKPEKQVVHKSGDTLKNKNPLNANKTSRFDYDLVKDKRYTIDQFELHLPIEINYKSVSRVDVNTLVRENLKNKTNQYFIGIDRGERHLLYISVIDSSGRIIEQESLNTICNGYSGIEHSVDYHGLLDARESERDAARKEWKTIESIKELKAGYLSQVVRRISELVIKYDAIIILEDLNSGFKNSRVKVEKQVYQNFEKALIEKMNFLVFDKSGDPESVGGLFHAYQLTAPFESFTKMGKQTGIIFYVPAWLTSKIDPVTGFADMFPKLKTESEIRKCISEMDNISFDETKKMFKFTFSYSKISGCRYPIERIWVAYSNGERIVTERDPKQNNQYASKSIDITNEIISLFEKNSVDWSLTDLRETVQAQKGTFIKEFWKLFKLTIQMRNSMINSETDYLVSPIEKNGVFYRSGECPTLPNNADANGAYNIARKGVWVFNQIKEADDVRKAKLAISNKEWLEMVQKDE